MRKKEPVDFSAKCARALHEYLQDHLEEIVDELRVGHMREGGYRYSEEFVTSLRSVVEGTQNFLTNNYAEEKQDAAQE